MTPTTKPKTIDEIILDAIEHGLGDKVALAIALKRARRVLVKLKDRCDCDLAIHQPERRECVGALATHGLAE